MKTVFKSSILLVCICTLTSCQGSTPNCSSADVQALLKKEIAKEVLDKRNDIVRSYPILQSISEDDVVNDLHITDVLPEKVDESINKTECKANLSITKNWHGFGKVGHIDGSGDETFPIKFTAQFTGGNLYVERQPSDYNTEILVIKTVEINNRSE